MKTSSRADARLKNQVSRVLRSLPTVTALALLMGILTLSVAACGGGTQEASTSPAEGNPPAKPTGTLRAAIDEALHINLDPTKGGVFPIITAVYDGLVTRIPGDFNQLAPALATSWKANSDATRWTFTLRQGVKFTDGTPFNAAAAKKSLEYVMRPGSFAAFSLGPVSKISTPDDYTLVVTYKEPFPDLVRNQVLVKMISPKLLAGPPKIVEQRLAKGAGGTGPYVLDSFSQSGAVVHANPRYWGDGPHIATINFIPLRDESARITALQAGDIDLVMTVSPRSAQTLARNPRLKVASVPSWFTYALHVPTQKKPLDDVRVRRALAYAFDPAAVAKYVLLDRAVVDGSLQPAGTYGYRKPETQYSYDPAKAKALLKEAGITEPVPLTLVDYGNPAGQEISEALADQAKSAGFDITFKQVSQTAGIADLGSGPQRRWDLHLSHAGWINGGPFHLPFTLGYASYKGKKLSDLISEINATADGPRREELIADALEEIAKEVVTIPLFTGDVIAVATDRLHGWLPPKDGWYMNWSEVYLG